MRGSGGTAVTPPVSRVPETVGVIYPCVPVAWRAVCTTLYAMSTLYRASDLRSRLRVACGAIALLGLCVPSVAGAMSANGMQRIGALTLSNGAYGGLYSATIDPVNGYAYFAGKSGWVVKMDIKGPLPVELGAVQCPSGQPSTALIDVAAGYAYFITSKIDRVALGVGDNPPAYVDTLTLSGYAFAAVIDTSDPDPSNHYAYAVCPGSPNQVSKISLATFTVIGSTSLNPGETSFRRGVIDTQNGYAYFVGPVAEIAPPSVVKVALGSGANLPARIGAVQLDSVAHGMGAAVIDVANGYAYFGTYYGANSVPSTVYKVALGAGNAPPTLVDQVSLSAGTGAHNGPDAAERELCSTVIDPVSGYAYFGTDHTYPAKIFQVSLGIGAAAPVETGVLPLAGGSHAIGEPAGPNDGENVINNPSSLYDEVFLQSGVFDPIRGYAYFGTDGYPGKIVKVLIPNSAAPSICGDGIVQNGEQCDDSSANGQPGGCCSASCQFAQAGAQCADDGNPCTSDVCNAVGACTHPVPLAAGCQTAKAGKSTVRLKRGRTSKTDSLAWNVVRSDLGASRDLGDPLHTTAYTLCVMDSTAAGLDLVLHATAPAGGTCGGKPCWSGTGSGYGYRDKSLARDGLSALSLRPAAAGRGKMSVLGRGRNLHMPALGLTGPVVVRLTRDDAPACWEATFSKATRSDARQFKATSD